MSKGIELEQQTDLHLQVSHSITSGICFLDEHQMPNGEFCCYYAPDDKMLEWCVPDSTTFPTSLISACLLPLRENEKVSKILSSAAGFLQYQRMAGGVWNYFTKWNPFFSSCPADIDDTIFASYVLKAMDYEIPGNNKYLLANRNSKGLFYTWFVLRPTKFKYLSWNYFKIMARELKRPLHTILFWWKHEASRSDIDAVVNANILFYLGLNAETKPIIEYLIKVIVEEKETSSDGWYKNPFTVYYFISRNYHKVPALEPIRAIIIQRVLALKNTDGSFNSSALETALALLTLLNLEYAGDLTGSVKFLLDKQQSSGCWERYIFFYSGHSKAVGWGSEELSTAYCMAALEAFGTKINQ